MSHSLLASMSRGSPEVEESESSSEASEEEEQQERRPVRSLGRESCRGEGRIDYRAITR